MRSSTAYRTWLPGWLDLLLLAMLNGTVRSTVLRRRLGEETARRDQRDVVGPGRRRGRRESVLSALTRAARPGAFPRRPRPPSVSGPPPG